MLTDSLITIPLFIAIFILLVFAHETGHFITAKASGVTVLEFGFGYPPRLFAIKRGDTEYSLNLLPLGGFVKMLGEENPAEPGSLAGKSIGSRFVVLISGCIMNALLALVFLTAALMIPAQVVTGGEQIQVKQVVAGSPAALAGMQAGDIIVSIDETPVATSDELREAVNARLGTEMTIGLLRDGAQVEVVAVPRANPPPGEGALGITFGWAIVHTETRSYPFWQALPQAARFCVYMPVLIKDGIVTMIVQRDVSGLGGPIGIAQATGEVAKLGVQPLIQWVGILSMFLAIMNLLPIPALDGGRLLFVVIEAIRRGKRIPPEKERLVHLIGFALLLTLMLAATYNDILRIIRGESIFK